MGISYRYSEDGDLWEVRYNETYILIPNDIPDNELGFMAPAIVKGNDEEMIKMVFDFAKTMFADEMDNCDVLYLKGGLCHISQWWKMAGNRKKLYRKHLLEMLDKIYIKQTKFQYVLITAQELLFSPTLDE